MKKARKSDARPLVKPCQGLDDRRIFKFRLKNTRTGQVVLTKGAALKEAILLLEWDPAIVSWVEMGGLKRHEPLYLSASGWRKIEPPFVFLYMREEVT